VAFFDPMQGEPVERLDSITVKGFKSIASIENLKLGAINVLIGANGSGKSNFIGVFQFLNAIRAGRLQEYIARSGGANNVLHFGSKVTSNLELKISFKDGINQYEIDLIATDQDELIPGKEYVGFWNKSYPQPKWDRLNGSRHICESGIFAISGIG
jgi:predicted ATPase